MSFLINCFGIEVVLCDLYLTRFDFTKGSSFDTFFTALFFTNCAIVMKFESFSIAINW